MSGNRATIPDAVMQAPAPAILGVGNPPPPQPPLPNPIVAQELARLPMTQAQPQVGKIAPMPVQIPGTARGNASVPIPGGYGPLGSGNAAVGAGGAASAAPPAPTLRELANVPVDMSAGQAQLLKTFQDTTKAEIARLDKLMAAPAEGHAERMAAIAEARGNIRNIVQQWNEIAQHPPQMKPVDTFSNMGSLTILLAALGGLASRAPFTASLGAMGAGLQAVNQNNFEQFKVQQENWKLQTELGLKNIGLLRESVKDIVDDDKMATDQKNAMLGLVGKEAGLELAPVEKAIEWSQQSQQAEFRLKSQQQMFEHQTDMLASRLNAQQAGKTQIWGDPTKPDKAGNPTPFSYNPITKQSSTPAGEPYAPGGFQKIGAASQASPNPQAVDAAARMIAAYRLPPLSGWALRSAYGQAVMRRVDELNPKYDAAQYIGKVSSERTIGTRGATLMTASNAADQLIPIVEGLSSKVNRTNYPDINKVLLAGRERSGDPDVVRFGQSLNSLLYVYMRALNPSGVPRVADLERGQQILQTAWSQGQLQGALDLMKVEIGAEKTAIQLSAQDMGGMFGGDMSPVLAPYKSADDVLKAIDSGSLPKAQGRQIILENHWGVSIK